MQFILVISGLASALMFTLFFFVGGLNPFRPNLR